MSNELTFGKLISQKRKEKNTSLRQMAKQLGISAEYLSSLENDKRTNPNIKILQKLIFHLSLNEEETALIYDLQAMANGTVSNDLTEYIMQKNNVRKTLRIAKKKSIPDEDWSELFNQLIKRE